MRRVGESVAVRTEQVAMAAGAETVQVPGAGAPEAFVWRGRLYVVREVLGHWRERRAWWTAAAARAVHGESDRGEGRAGGGGEDAGAMAPGQRVVLDDEQEIWRVEASAGRTFGSGVYDLSRESAAWQLLRVTD